MLSGMKACVFPPLTLSRARIPFPRQNAHEVPAPRFSRPLTHRSREQLLERVIDPRLHVQPPLQLLPVILHRHTRRALLHAQHGARARETLTVLPKTLTLLLRHDPGALAGVRVWGGDGESRERECRTNGCGRESERASEKGRESLETERNSRAGITNLFVTKSYFTVTEPYDRLPTWDTRTEFT